jgi:uncharacterized protein YkwD
MKRIISIILIAGATATAVAGVVLWTPPQAGASVTLTKIERQVIVCVNQKRVRHGLARVHAQANLMRAARAHSCDMAQRCFFAHTSAAGQTYVQRVIAFGYERTGWSRWSVGENLYSGRAGTLLATAQVAVMRWMGSPAHRRVLLRKGFRDVGIGVHVGGGKRYFTLDMGLRVR